MQIGMRVRSVNRCNEARTLANQVRHPLTMALAYLSYVHLLRREVDEGRRWAEKQGRSLSMGMWRKASNRHATG